MSAGTIPAGAGRARSSSAATGRGARAFPAQGSSRRRGDARRRRARRLHTACPRVRHGGQVVSFDDNVSRWVADNVPGGVEWVARLFTWLGGAVGTVVVAGAAVIVLWRASRRTDAQLRRARGARDHSARRGAEGDLRAGAARSRQRDPLASLVLVPERARRNRCRALRGARSACRGAGTVALRAAGWLAAAAVVAFAIGASRILLNVHFVSDVAAGFAVGLAWLGCCLIARDVLSR